MMVRKGIAVAGNLVADTVKEIDAYPERGRLADIRAVRRSVGGSVPNTLLSLAAMQSGVPLMALGRVGDDEAGAYLLDQLRGAGVDASRVVVDSMQPTSFSDAMFALDTGERTFFHHRGANAAFCPADIDLDALPCNLLHVAYLLLLDAFDAPDSEFGTVMARFLCEAQKRGVRTCVDAVSGGNGRAARIVPPALRYCDYAVMNELESCEAMGLAPRDANGRLLIGNIEEALRGFLRAGVRRRAILHCPEAGFCLDAKDGMAIVPSLLLPEGYVKGSVGAGDAFAAGCLYAIHQGWSAEDMLRFASAAAAASLSEADSHSGVQDAETLKRMMNQWRRQKL